MNCFFRMRFTAAVAVAVCGFASISDCQTPLAQLVTSEVRNADKISNREDDGTCRVKHIKSFRLEVGANKSIYLLVSGPMGSAPMELSLERHSGKILWREPASGRTFSSPPKVKILSAQPGAQWIPLPPSAVYQWETNQCAMPGKNQSLTVFIREDMNREPIEVAAPCY